MLARQQDLFFRARRDTRSAPGAAIEENVIARFAAADPDLAGRRELQRRTDSKFLVRAHRLSELIAPLAGKYALLYAGDQAFASYRTLYFDTPSYRCFRDHRRGLRPRAKVRIRHYDDRELSYLEVKTTRSDAFTVKHRVQRSFGDHRLCADDRVFVTEHSRVPGDELVPIVWTNFRRLTLISVEHSERMTIDVGLELSRADRRIAIDGIAIVEVKQSPRCAHTPAMRALRSAGLRQAASSKYCSALALTADPGRMNRPLSRTA